MGINGNLKDISVADLIQIHCIDQRTARLKIDQQDQAAEIFFNAGQVVHATLGQASGEEAVYEILTWTEGLFNVDNDVTAPKKSINRMWSGLLLEGAKRLDEKEMNRKNSEENQSTEEMKMGQKFEEILTSLAGEVSGYSASALVGIDGINIAANSKGPLDPEAVSAQMTMLFRLVDGSVEKLGAGVLEDNLMTTEKSYILMRFLPGKEYYLSITADRKTGNLGNLRLMSKMYTDQLSKAMPH
jgi:predicted regulator of Ras-like GTPase activity (Roadblock/LC7/MglB family)